MQKTSTFKGLNTTTPNSKGHKISAALYLITNHVSDSDPLKRALREHAVALTTASGESKVHEIEALLEVAVLAGLIRQQNALIIIRELASHKAIHTMNTINHLFQETGGISSGRNSAVSDMSFISKTTSQDTQKININNDNKNKRQEEILSFINQRKSAVIKDISALFPDVSEKTIQRELGTLVESGKITKRGSKRWSIYLAA